MSSMLEQAIVDAKALKEAAIKNAESAIIDKYQTNFKDLMVGDTITKLIKAPWVLEDIFHELESFIFSNSLVVITSFFYLSYYNRTLGILYLISMGVIFSLCVLFSNSCSNIVKKAERYIEKNYKN